MNVATGVFNTVDNAEEALKALLDAGFANDHIGLFVCDQSKGQMLASDVNREYRLDGAPDRAFSDNAVFCHLSDRYVDTIRHSNLPEEAVTWYQQHLDNGDILEIIDVGNRMEDADRIIRAHGGLLFIDRRGETAELREGMAESHMVETSAAAQQLALPIIEEEVTLEKTRRTVGEVEIRSDTRRETVDIPTTVTHEEIRVERRKLDRTLDAADYQGQLESEAGVIRLPIVEEEVRVVKRPIVREELIVTRVPVTERQMLHETVEHTEPHIETRGEVKVDNLTEERTKRRPAA